MVDAVIFDFGGVLTNSPTHLMAARAAEFGHDLRDVMHLLLGPFDEDTDHPWHRIERGEISFDEMVEGMVGVFADAGIQDGNGHAGTCIAAAPAKPMLVDSQDTATDLTLFVHRADPALDGPRDRPTISACFAVPAPRCCSPL